MRVHNVELPICILINTGTFSRNVFYFFLYIFEAYPSYEVSFARIS